MSQKREDKETGVAEEKDAGGMTTKNTVVKHKQLLKGMRLRDEFLCPITFDLMTDPVVAADGHSYERSPITKWISSKENSPRTGEPLESKLLVSLL
jgi:hypothetical protein